MWIKLGAQAQHEWTVAPGSCKKLSESHGYAFVKVNRPLPLKTKARRAIALFLLPWVAHF